MVSMHSSVLQDCFNTDQSIDIKGTCLTFDNRLRRVLNLLRCRLEKNTRRSQTDEQCYLPKSVNVLDCEREPAACGEAAMVCRNHRHDFGSKLKRLAPPKFAIYLEAAAFVRTTAVPNKSVVRKDEPSLGGSPNCV